MSKDPKKPKDRTPITPIPLPDPNDRSAKRWLIDLHVAIDDMDAVIRDQLRKKRNRDLGHREQKRLYKEARDRLRELLASAGGGDDGDGGDESGDESGRDPAGSGGSPAH